MSKMEIVGDSVTYDKLPNWFAQDLEEHIPLVSGGRIDAEAVIIPTEAADVVLFCRTVEEGLEQTIEHCNETVTPLIHLSTDVAFPLDTKLETSVILAPNASIEAARFKTEVIRLIGALMQGGADPSALKVIIDEYHQHFKKTTSGYANDIKASLHDLYGVAAEVEPHRDWAEARDKFDIPDEYEKRYAIHEVAVGTEVSTATLLKPLEIRGRVAYVEGTVAVGDALNDPGLIEHFPAGTVSFTDLVINRVIGR